MQLDNLSTHETTPWRHIFWSRYHPPHRQHNSNDAPSTTLSTTSFEPARQPGRRMQLLIQRQISETSHTSTFNSFSRLFSGQVWDWPIKISEFKHNVICCIYTCFICYFHLSTSPACFIFFFLWFLGTSVEDNTSSKGRVMSRRLLINIHNC